MVQYKSNGFLFMAMISSLVFDITEEFRLIIPNYVVSFCTSRMNYTHVFGCVSTQKEGTVIVIRSAIHAEHVIQNTYDYKIVVVLPYFIFASTGIMNRIIQSKMITGIVVLSPGTEEMKPNISYFSEFQQCNNHYSICNKSTNNIFFDGYYFHQWRIPVVLLSSDYPEYQQNIIDCYENYNYQEDKGSKCMMSIINHNPYALTSKDCLQKSNSWLRKFQLVKEDVYCENLFGKNIYITFNNVPSYKDKSVILISTKMDSISMFDTAAHGNNELYPSLSTMIYLAILLKEAADNNTLENDQDILLTFIDNDSVDHLGSLRLVYDLKFNRVSNTVHNISDRHIKLIILLDDLSGFIDNFVIVTNGCENQKICEIFKKHLWHFAQSHNLKLLTYESKDKDKYKIWMELGAPLVEITASLVSLNAFKNSFIDNKKPELLVNLRSLGLSLGSALVKTLQKKYIMVDYSFKFDKFDSSNITSCFHDISCLILKNLIGPLEKKFIQYNSPHFISQSYADGSIKQKRGMYFSRLNEIVLKFLIIFLSYSKSINDSCYDVINLKTFSTRINDKLYCFETKIQIETDFNPVNYMPKFIQRDNSFFVNYPVWMRSGPLQVQRLILFVSVNTEVYITTMVIGTIITALCFVSSIFLHRNINVLIPDDEF